jgi:hypothetical protein
MLSKTMQAKSAQFDLKSRWVHSLSKLLHKPTVQFTFFYKKIPPFRDCNNGLWNGKKNLFLASRSGLAGDVLSKRIIFRSRDAGSDRTSWQGGMHWQG